MIQDVATHVLRTSFADVKEQLPRVLDQYQPNQVVVFGYAGASSSVRLERRAQNACTSNKRDVDGRLAPRVTVRGGKDVLPTTLPLGELKAALTNSGFRVSYSDSAGGYVCNFTFYLLQHLADRYGVSQSGLIHLPSSARYRAVAGDDFDYRSAMEVIDCVLASGRQHSSSDGD